MYAFRRLLSLVHRAIFAALSAGTRGERNSFVKYTTARSVI
jgi:hypothetical protein